MSIPTTQSFTGNMETVPARQCGIIHTDLLDDVRNATIGDMYSGVLVYRNIETVPVRRCGLIHSDLLGDAGIAPAFGDMYGGVWAGNMYSGLKWHAGEMGTTYAGDMDTTVFGEMETTLLTGSMYAGYVTAGARPVISYGIMETTSAGGVPVTPDSRRIGDIPIGPARFFGDIYAMGVVVRAGDSQTVPVIGDIYCGVWAGEMLTGVKQQPGDTETTLAADRDITEFGEPGMPPVIGPTPVDAPGTFGELPITPARSCGDMYAGVWAGQMTAGPSAAFGYMETT